MKPYCEKKRKSKFALLTHVNEWKIILIVPRKSGYEMGGWDATDQGA